MATASISCNRYQLNYLPINLLVRLPEHMPQRKQTYTDPSAEHRTLFHKKEEKKRERKTSLPNRALNFSHKSCSICLILIPFESFNSIGIGQKLG